MQKGPGLGHFIKLASATSKQLLVEPTSHPITQQSLKFHIETYGCQMNVSDSEIVTRLLLDAGHIVSDDLEKADLVLTNTCAIRDNAESKVWHRLKYFRSMRRKRKPRDFTHYPLVGVLGCMAERLKDRLLTEESVDFVCGPDSYRDIPRLLERVMVVGQKQANTMLSFEETYADIAPVRQVGSTSAFVSIMRGCNNMCSFCIVPFTRGRERSRPMASILGEVAALSAQGIKEVVLLGQNVNGYHDTSEESAFKFPPTPYKATPGFSNLYRSRKRELAGARFPDLLRAVAGIDPEMRVRFTSPHPKDFPEEVLEVVAETHNICAALHLPVQSGSSAVLERMRRGYSREAYLQLVENVRRDIPGVTLSTDIITGFCGESEAEHADSLSLMEQVQFEQAFMFAYSLRERTHAAHTMQDNVPEDIKQRRLREIIEVYRRNVALRNSQEDSEQLRVVLVEGEATKSTPEQPMLTGRTDGNKRVVFPEQDVPLFSEALANPLLLRGLGGKLSLEHMQKRAELVGQYALVKINKADSSTLRGKMISHITLRDYKQHQTLLTSSPKL